MPHYKSIAEFESLKDATPAETALIAACKAGEPCIISETRPEVEPTGNTIRADLLRLLIIGGSKDCGLQDSGVWLKGGWITGELDLNFATARGITMLAACTFSDLPLMMQTHLRLLNLEASRLPGLMAQGIVVKGSVSFRNLIANGTIHVNSARITGQLNLVGATLNGHTGPEPWGDSLNAQGVKVGEDLFFSSLTAIGMVDVGGAQITGQMDCEGASFDGKGNNALNAQRLTVGQGFMWRHIAKVTGRVYLSGAKIGDLVDDLESWPDDLYLDGLTYDRISGAPTDAKRRLGWLAKGAIHKGTFFPQPYTQLAKVLFAMGHDREARRVLIASRVAAATHDRSLLRSQRKLARSLRLLSRKPGKQRADIAVAEQKALPSALRRLANASVARFNLFHSPFPTAPGGPTPPPRDMMELARQDFRNEMWALAASCRLRIGWNWTKDILLRGLIGYGHAPERSLVAMVILIAITGFFAASTWSEGSFAPNSAVILTSPEWVEVAARDCKGVPPPKLPAGAPTCDRNPAETWSNDPDRGMDWTSFSPGAYAADLVIPVLDFGQTSAWAPSKDRGSWGWFFWWASWWLEGLGWVITALAAAAITGLIQRDRE